MNEQPRSLFAVSLREEPDEASLLVIDALEAAHISDDDWNWIIWSRGSQSYIVISAPLLAKGAVSSIEGVKMHPIASIAGKMNDNRNDWLEPPASARSGSLELAEKLLAEWGELQFIVDEAAKEAIALPIPSQLKERTRIATRSEVFSKTRRREMRTQQRSDNTVSALGLDMAKDSQGRGFTFTKLDG